MDWQLCSVRSSNQTISTFCRMSEYVYIYQFITTHACFLGIILCFPYWTGKRFPKNKVWIGITRNTGSPRRSRDASLCHGRYRSRWKKYLYRIDVFLKCTWTNVLKYRNAFLGVSLSKTSKRGWNKQAKISRIGRFQGISFDQNKITVKINKLFVAPR